MSKMPRFSAFSNVNFINWKIFPRHGGIYKSENSTSILERDKEIRMFPWGQSWRTRVVNKTVYQFVVSNLEVEIFLKKEVTLEKGCAQIEDWVFSVHCVLGFQENSI